MGKQLVNYLKFDLPRASWAGFVELAAVARKEGAASVSLIVEGQSGASCAGMSVGVHPRSEYVVIKVPTLDGTELWIMSQSRQADVEKTAGFDRTSVPLLTLRSESLSGRPVLNPVTEEVSSIQLSDQVVLETGTGVSLILPACAGSPGKEIVQ
jgi:hypothetical protein